MLLTVVLHGHLRRLPTPYPNTRTHCRIRRAPQSESAAAAGRPRSARREATTLSAIAPRHRTGPPLGELARCLGGRRICGPATRRSAALISVAAANASIAATAVTVGYQQPRSSAVLVGDVTVRPPIISISSASTTSLCSCSPAARWWLSWISSTARAVIHPFASVQRGRREPRHNSPATGPQPPGLRAHRGAELGVAIDVDAPKKPTVARFQLTLGQPSSTRWLRCRRMARPSPQRRTPDRRRHFSRRAPGQPHVERSNARLAGRSSSTEGCQPRIRPDVGTPVPAVTRTCSTSGTGFTDVPRNCRTPSAMPFMPWM